MGYPPGKDPYTIDYLQQKNMIDVGVSSQVDQIVILSSMGGYRKPHKMNDIGRKTSTLVAKSRLNETDNKTAKQQHIFESDKVGNLLKWKRATEGYLMKRCFFTIIHAGLITNTKGGFSQIVYDTDDSLLRTAFKKISKEDLAEVLVQSLLHSEAIGRSIDVGSRFVGKTFKMDWLRFWSIPGNNLYPTDD